MFFQEANIITLNKSPFWGVGSWKTIIGIGRNTVPFFYGFFHNSLLHPECLSSKKQGVTHTHYEGKSKL
jgi:hypothetical protein